MNLKIVGIVLAALLLLTVVGSVIGLTTAEPDAGHEAVLVEKPFLFGSGGVDDTPITTGRKFIARTTTAIYINMQPQQFPVHFDDLMSSDGVPLDFDAVIRLQVTNSVILIKNFGPHWYDNNIEKEFANRVRQAVRKHGMNDTAISTSAIEAIDDEVSKAMETYIKSAGLPLKLIQITVGKANPPDSVKDQRIETAAQEQRALTEQKRKLAEDQRKEAEKSRAEADNAFRNAMDMSPEQYLRLENIKMQRDVCAGGKCTFILTDGKVSPIINANR